MKVELNFHRLKSLKEKKVLLVCDNKNDYPKINKVLNELKNQNNEDYVVFASDFFLEKRLIEKNVPFRCREDYIENDDFLGIYKKAIYFAENWFKFEQAKDNTKYKNISLGNILLREMIKYFNILLMNIVIAKKVINKENPDIMFLFNDLSEEISGYQKAVSILETFSFIGRSTGICILYQSKAKTSFLFKSLEFGKNYLQLEEKWVPLFGTKFKVKFPKIIWEIVLRLIVLKKTISQNSIKKNKKTNILFSNEAGINYLGWNLPDYLLKQKNYNLFVLGAIFRHQNLPIKEIIRQNFYKVFYNLFSPKLPQNKFSKTQYKKSTHKLFNFQDIFFVDLIMEDIKLIYEKTFSNLVAEIDYLLSILKKHSINFVISSDDTARANKTLTLAAKSVHIPTLVVQHGFPGHYLGYLPLSAHKIALMGKFSQKWFTKNHVPEERIAVTGIPRFEELFIIKKTMHKKNYILFAGELGSNMGYVSVSLTHKVNENIFLDLIKTMKHLKKEILIVKLKSNDGQYGYYNKLINQSSCKNIKIVINEDAKVLIQNCKVLITTFSTMGIEAILLNKPVIIINYFKNHKLLESLWKSNIISSKNIIPLLEYKAAFGVNKVEDLPGMIESLTDNHKAQTLQKGRNKFIKEYVFQENNTSAHERIENLIGSML